MLPCLPVVTAVVLTAILCLSQGDDDAVSICVWDRKQCSSITVGTTGISCNVACAYIGHREMKMKLK